MTEQEPKSREDFESEIIAKAWQNEAFKRELMTNPKAAIAREFGELPADLEIRVVEETPKTLYLVLPPKPDVTPESEELSDAELESVTGGFIGSLRTRILCNRTRIRIRVGSVYVCIG